MMPLGSDPIMGERSDHMDATVDHPTGAKNGTPQHEESSESSSRPKLGRLSVNVTPATQAALDRLAEREGVTVTEALRRLVGYGDLVYETTKVNGDDLLIRRDGVLERIVLI
jgi:hypothetical protein